MACNGNCASCGISEDVLNFKDLGIRDGFIYNFNTHSKPISAVINLTDECTHRCRMCFVKFQPEYMKLETAIATVEFLLKNTKDGQVPQVTFFGGEPLIQFERIIKPLVEMYKDRVSWSITTNGFLLSEDIVDFFRKYNVQILLSWDGDKMTQDYQRPLKNGEGSFDKSVRNIPYLLLRFPNTTMRATITKFSIPLLYENYLFAKKMGFKAVTFIMDSRREIEYSIEDKNILTHQINKIAADLTYDLLKGRTPIIVENLIDTYRLLRKANDANVFNNEIFRCGTGITSVGVTTNGELVGCQENNSCPEDNEIIGNVFEGINLEKHRVFIEKVIQELDNVSIKSNGCGIDGLVAVNKICPNRIKDSQLLAQGETIMKYAEIQAARKWLILFKDSIFPNVYQYLEG